MQTAVSDGCTLQTGSILKMSCLQNSSCTCQSKLELKFEVLCNDHEQSYRHVQLSFCHLFFSHVLCTAATVYITSLWSVIHSNTYIYYWMCCLLRMHYYFDVLLQLFFNTHLGVNSRHYSGPEKGSDFSKDWINIALMVSNTSNCKPMVENTKWSLHALSTATG